MCQILVTDDDPVQLSLRKMLLETAGHEVAVAADRASTLEQFECRRPDLVIMDLRLPNAEGDPDPLEGRELIRNIREQSGRVPIVVLSGWPAQLYGEPEEEMVSLVILKPVGARDLLQAIAELVG